MIYKFLLGITLAIANVHAISFAEVGSTLSSYSKQVRSALPSFPVLEKRKDPECPAIWKDVVTDLTALFIDRSVTPSQCNDAARAAIRAAFHDCGTWDKSQGATGGCDGSLILNAEEGSRSENNGLQEISATLLNMQMQPKYSSISVADLIQVASSVAIVTCPGGPVVTTYVGRRDSSSANPSGGLPDVHAQAAKLYQLFLDKGFDARDLAALLGAHSTSKAFKQDDIPTNTSQDTTPGIWDVKYYQETINPPPTGMKPFASDTSLAAHPEVGKEFKGFVNNQGKWTGKFADAMLKMSLLGVPGGSDPKKNLIDCTKVIPRGTSIKRDIRAAPINDRAR